MTLLDNKKNGHVVDALRASLETASEVFVLSSEFSVFAFDALKQVLKNLDQSKLLLTTARQSPSATPMASELLGGPEERRLRNTLLAASIARTCAEWIEANVEVRGVEASVPHSMYVTKGAAVPRAVQGSSTFSAPGLGLVPSARFEMNTLFEGADQVEGLEYFFSSLWNDTRITKVVKTQLLSELKRVYEPRSAQLVYFAVLRALFHDTLDQLDEDEIVKARTGIKDTLVWQQLYRFQRDGVLGAIDKIERHNGCIIADSVGLGKTFEALAVIKYVDLHPILSSLCIQEMPHRSVAQSNTVKQSDCCNRGNSECKNILFLVQISMQINKTMSNLENATLCQSVSFSKPSRKIRGFGTGQLALRLQGLQSEGSSITFSSQAGDTEGFTNTS